jgi:hypothetical protein
MASQQNLIQGVSSVMDAPQNPDILRSLVLRAASSRHFAKANQLRDILVYLAERAIADPGGAVREHDIGCTVLGRKPDFDPHEDNIVRVQVSHIRKRLEAYYGEEGSQETLRVAIPKGGYALRLEPVAPRGAVAALAAAPALPAPRRTRLLGKIAMVLIVLSLATVLFRAVARPADHVAPPAHDLLWQKMFSGQPVNIVVADTCLVMLQDVLDTDIGLSDYVTGRYPENLLAKTPDGSLRRALRLIAGRQYTSLADVNSSAWLLDLSRRYGAPAPAVRYARHLNVRDFKNGNFVLAGSRRGIPWVRLFEPQLNFALEQDPRTRGYVFRNRNPKAGEQPSYSQQTAADGTVDTYADVALVPNLGNTGYVLLLDGIGMEAAEAAGELVTGAELRKILTAITPKKGTGDELHFFEILLHTRAVAGAARNSQVVAWRLLPEPAGGG